MSDVLVYICDYPEGEDRVALDLDVVKQISNIFDLGLAFVVGSIKAVKKDKSQAVLECSKAEVE